PGRLSGRRYSNGIHLTVTDPAGAPGWDEVQRMTALRHVRGDVGEALASFAFTYDRVGNRTSIQRLHDGGLRDEYRYDSLSRVVESRFDRAAAPPPGDDPTPPVPLVDRGLTSRTYLLDGAGNRASVATITSGSSVASVTTYVANSVNAYTAIG